MKNIHEVKTEQKTYKLNFNSYAIMQCYKKHGVQGLETITQNELNFDMIRFGLSENGTLDISEAQVYEFVDSVGGLFSDTFKQQITQWVLESFNLSMPESKKKEEAAEV